MKGELDLLTFRKNKVYVSVLPQLFHCAELFSYVSNYIL